MSLDLSQAACKAINFWILYKRLCLSNCEYGLVVSELFGGLIKNTELFFKIRISTKIGNTMSFFACDLLHTALQTHLMWFVISLRKVVGLAMSCCKIAAAPTFIFPCSFCSSSFLDLSTYFIETSQRKIAVGIMSLKLIISFNKLSFLLVLFNGYI